METLMDKPTGDSAIEIAKSCFEQNLNDYGNNCFAPEKHYLYKGFYNLAETVEQLQRQVHVLQVTVIQLQQQIQK
jgi:hypothetical protein